MDKATNRARFDTAARAVIVDYIKQDGSNAQIQVDLDAAEAIMEAISVARPDAPLELDDSGIYQVQGFQLSPLAGELHMTLRVADDREATFVLAAPTRSESEVAAISKDLQRVYLRLIPPKYRN